METNSFWVSTSAVQFTLWSCTVSWSLVLLARESCFLSLTLFPRLICFSYAEKKVYTSDFLQRRPYNLYYTGEFFHQDFIYQFPCILLDFTLLLPSGRFRSNLISFFTDNSRHKVYHLNDHQLPHLHSLWKLDLCLVYSVLGRISSSR